MGADELVVSLLGGGNKSSLPSLSWNSVVEPSSGDDTDAATAGDGADVDAQSVGDQAPGSGGGSAPSAPIGQGISGVLGSLGIETGSDAPAPVTLDLTSSSVEPAPVEPAPVQYAPVEQPPVEQAPVQQAPVQYAPVEQPPVEQAPVQYAPVEQPPVEQAPVQYAPVEQPPVEQPPVEQAPVQYAPVQHAPVEQPPVEQAPVQQAPAVAPVVPQVAAAPSIPVAPAAQPLAAGSAHGYQTMMATPTKRRRRQGGGSGVGLLLTLIVLASLIAAGFVYGRPYLFPDDFDAQTKPYADAIESVRGTPIADPFLVLDESAITYATGYDAQVLGDDWHADAAMWRAFGLADSAFDPATVGAALPQRSSAYYAFADGQVHTDAPLLEGVPDAAVARAGALAVLDQDYQWSLAVDGPSDERAAVQHSLVIAEADRIRNAGGYPGPVAPDFSSGELAALPPLVAHRLAAPELYARVVGQPTTNDEARLRDLESFGVVLPALTPLGAGPAPVLADGDVIAGAARSMDRNFWFLLFDAHLPASSAADFSQALSGASVTPFQTAAGQSCWSATMVAPNPDAAFFLANGMNEWVAAAPAATTASTSVISDQVVELRACDPNPAAAPAVDPAVDPVAPAVDPATGAEAPAEGAPADVVGDDTVDPAAEPAAPPVLGTAESVRALQAYRATELAVVSGVSNAGGDTVAISQALVELAGTSIGDDLALAAVTMTDSQLASAAVERTAGIVQAVAATISVPAAPAPADGQVPVGSEAPVPEDG